jgi:hypothetical protein
MGSSPPKQNQQIPSGSADRALDMMTEQKLLSQQRLERYFNQSAQRERNVSPFLRRESSPAHLGSKENQKKLYKQSPFVEEDEEEESGGRDSPKKRNKRKKSTGAIGKIVKKLSSKKGEKPTIKNAKRLSTSSSNLEELLKNIRKSQSMEQIHGKKNALTVNGGQGRVTTPVPSPGATPRMTKGFFKARRNSEPDLENGEELLTIESIIYYFNGISKRQLLASLLHVLI